MLNQLACNNMIQIQRTLKKRTTKNHKAKSINSSHSQFTDPCYCNIIKHPATQ